MGAFICDKTGASYVNKPVTVPAIVETVIARCDTGLLPSDNKHWTDVSVVHEDVAQLVLAI